MFFPYCEIARSDGALLARQFQDGLLSRFFKGEPYKEFLAEYVQASWLLTKVMNSSTASAQATHLDEYAKNVPSQVRAARIADEYNQRMQRPGSTESHRVWWRLVC